MSLIDSSSGRRIDVSGWTKSIPAFVVDVDSSSTPAYAWPSPTGHTQHKGAEAPHGFHFEMYDVPIAPPAGDQSNTGRLNQVLVVPEEDDADCTAFLKELQLKRKLMLRVFRWEANLMKKYCAYDEGTMKYEQLLCMIRRMGPPDEEVDSNQGVLFNHQLDDPDVIPAGSTYEVECKANAVPTSKSSQLMSSMAYGKRIHSDMARKSMPEQFGRSEAPDAAKPKPGPKGQSTQSPKDDAEKSENADAVPGIEIVESTTYKRGPGKDAMQMQKIKVKFNEADVIDGKLKNMLDKALSDTTIGQNIICHNYTKLGN